MICLPRGDAYYPGCLFGISNRIRERRHDHARSKHDDSDYWVALVEGQRQIEARLDRLEGKMDKLLWSVFGLMGTVIGVLVMVVATMVIALVR